MRLEALLSEPVNYVGTRRKERFFLATKLWKDGVLPFVCHWCSVSNVSSQDRIRGKRLPAILGRDVFFCLFCSFFWIFKSTFQVCFVILVKFAQIFLFSFHLFLLSTNTCWGSSLYQIWFSQSVFLEWKRIWSAKEGYFSFLEFWEIEEEVTLSYG